MKLSAETLTVLKNFAAINPNIVVSAGSTLKTMAEAKNILGSSEIKEVFTSEFGMYDLNKFLGMHGMFADPDIEFSADKSHVSITEGRHSVKYFLSDPSILTYPQKDIKMPSTELSFTLSGDDLASIQKGAGAVGVSELVIKKEGETLVGLVTDTSNPTSDEFKIELGILSCECHDFEFIYNIANFKFIPGDYTVDISAKLISRFTSTQAEYFVALEKTSKKGTLND